VRLGERIGRSTCPSCRPGSDSSTALHDRIPPDETVLNVVGHRVGGARAVPKLRRLDLARAGGLLAQFGVAALAERRYGTLSEGERKRVQIARAMMTDPELLLLDEPAAGLDLGGREDLVRRLAHLAADPDAPALVLVTHHVEEIPPGFSHALLLRQGSAVAAGLVSDTITSANLARPSV
jgi:iron complex transport system ATP-binding protein